LAPRFYAGGARERLVVMEDLGPAVSLANVLEDEQATPAIEALRALAVTMARLLHATGAHEDVYDRLRTMMPGAAGLGRQIEARRWLAAIVRVEQWADAVGIRLPPGFPAACAHIASTYAEPGPFLAFSHGDPAPSNNQLRGAEVLLVDFEYAAYRHALYDLTAWDTLCPLPRAWVETMEQTFLQTAASGPLAYALADENGYRQARAAMCAYRALAMLTWLSPDVLSHDRAWVDGWTRREALISTAMRLHATSIGVDALAPVAETGRLLTEAFKLRWPGLGDGRPHWPAAAVA
jgi:hypothetical protein